MAKTISDYPDLMKIWDPEKNTLKPDEILKKSTEQVWWRCPKCGHSWQTSARGKKNDKCPACTGARNVVIPGKTDFSTLYPELGEDFVQELNPGVDATKLGAGSQERLTWRCHVCGHEWKAPVYGRIRREKKPYRVAKCPACAGQVRMKSFDEEFPELKELYSPNNPLPLSELPADWQAKYLWVCGLHGEFEAVLSSMIRAVRTGNTGCPYCSGKMVKKADSFGALHPDLVKEWSSENKLSPFEVTEHSKEIVKWVCDKGHIWETPVYTRAYGYGYCRECSPFPKNAKRVMDVFLDVYRSYRDNRPLEQVLVTDATEYEFECENGHRYKDTPYNINQRGKISCPVCDYRQIVPGVNDFETLYPEYAKDLVGDAKVSPIGSEIREWICPEGHYFRRSVKAHVKWNGVCPVCSLHVLQTGENDLLSVFPEVEGIWDYERNGCSPGDCTANTSKVRWWICEHGHSFRNSVDALLSHDWRCPVCNNFAQEKENPLSITNPELAKEWSPSNERGPDTVEEDACFRAKWICPTCNGEYSAEVRAREVGDDSCPYCSEKKILAGYNDLTTTDPELAKEWTDERPVTTVGRDLNYFARWKCPECGGEYGRNIQNKNIGDCPYCAGKRVLPGVTDLATTDPELAAEWSPSNERPVTSVHRNLSKHSRWICPECGGEYSASIKDRELGDCPYCADKKVLPGYNDLATTDPELASEWSEDNERDVTTVSRDMILRASWICPSCGGEYGSRIRDRKLGDCPYCENRRILAGFNDLATTDPELAAEWSPSNEQKATEVGNWYVSFAKWICPDCTNEYGYRIYKREVGDDSCPYCKGIRVIKGFNDLVTTHPEIASEWAETNERAPDSVVKSYTDYADWQCPKCNGVYRSRIVDRELGDCPYCANKRTLSGLNDLATLKPELAKEWDPNNEFSPSQVRPDAGYKVKWLCPECGGKYYAKVNAREVGDDSCPYCADKKVLPGYNDLVTTDPLLAEEYSDSNDRDASHVMKTMKRPVFWNCPSCGGEYSFSLVEREVGDDSCPYCSERKVLPGYNSFKAKHPDLMEEWVWVNNYVLVDPDAILDTCVIPVWWQCKNDKDHRYKISPAARLEFQMRHMEPCTICKGRRRDMSRCARKPKKRSSAR